MKSRLLTPRERKYVTDALARAAADARATRERMLTNQRGELFDPDAIKAGAERFAEMAVEQDRLAAELSDERNELRISRTTIRTRKERRA